MSKVRCRILCILRFGTVNGYSPFLESDVMINVVNSHINDGHIKLYIKDTMRPILGINDLCEGIRYILVVMRIKEVCII